MLIQYPNDSSITSYTSNNSFLQHSPNPFNTIFVHISTSSNRTVHPYLARSSHAESRRCVPLCNVGQWPDSSSGSGSSCHDGGWGNSFYRLWSTVCAENLRPETRYNLCFFHLLETSSLLVELLLWFGYVTYFLNCHSDFSIRRIRIS